MALSWVDKAKYYSYLVARPPPTPSRYKAKLPVEQSFANEDQTDFAIQTPQGL